MFVDLCKCAKVLYMKLPMKIRARRMHFAFCSLFRQDVNKFLP